eukprot:evm.model.scf_3727.2 EVM.evm.TU.scf_3727.2   scf_3727:7371-11039(+)
MDDLDWDSPDFEVTELTVGALAIKEAEKAKFQDEDEEDEDEEEKTVLGKPRPPRDPSKASKAQAKKCTVPVDQPLDDPVAEKARQQRLQEEADFQNTLEALGDEEFKKLQKFIPRTEKDFDEFVQLLLSRFFSPHKESKQYRHMLKQLMRGALDSAASSDVKELETCLVGVRMKRQQEEKRKEQESKEKKGKKFVNVGSNRASAGLEDYIYDDGGLDDDYDFM